MKKIFQICLICLLIPTLLLGVLPGALALDDQFVQAPVPGDVETVTAASEGLAVVQNAAGAYGVTDANGNMVVPFGAYLWIDAYSQGYALVKAGSTAAWHWAYIDAGGQAVLDASAWDKAGRFSSGLARVGSDDGSGSTVWGFIDKTGALALNCSQYSAVGEFSDGYARVETTQGSEVTYGFIDASGSTIIGGLQSATDFSGGYALVQVYNTLSRKSVSCLIDTTGTPTVDLSKYTNLSPVSDGLILVSPQAGTQLAGYGYMDRTGAVVIDCAGCEFVYPFSDGLALTEYLDNAGNLCYAYIDQAGDTFLDLGNCDLAVSYCDGYAIYQQGQTWYLMDVQGAVTYSSRDYAALDSYSDGVLVAHRSENGVNTYDLLTASGQLLAQGLRYDYIDAFSDGLALGYRFDSAAKAYYYDFIDQTGTVVLDCSQYDSVGAFSQGLLLVSNNLTDSDGHYAGVHSQFIDKTGAVVLDCGDYYNVGSFSDGLVLVMKTDSSLEDRCLFLDRNGNVVLDCSEYDAVTPFCDGVAVAAVYDETSQAYRCALIDTSGAKLTGFLDYNTVSGFAQGLCVVNRTSTMGQVDRAFYMNTDGTTYLSGLDYDVYESFSDGMAIVGRQSGGQTLYGCIDKTGALVVPLDYDAIIPFSQGVTWARQSGRWYCLQTLTLPFTDVSETDWYYTAVGLAYRSGLMKGLTDTGFAPDGTVSLGQAVTLAVRAYCQYYGVAEPVQEGGVWYQSYVDFALRAGILQAGDFVGYDRDATRGELAYLFSRILPEESYAAVNTVSDIPDVSNGYAFRDQVYDMFRAGILTGYDDGNFRPDATVRRSEVAAIIVRVLQADQRVVIE